MMSSSVGLVAERRVTESSSGSVFNAPTLHLCTSAVLFLLSFDTPSLPLSALQMSTCSSRALTILSTVFGACGLLLVGVAVSTDYWLIMVEGIILQTNQSMEVKMALHSGLWRVCFVAGRGLASFSVGTFTLKKKNCSRVTHVGILRRKHIQTALQLCADICPHHPSNKHSSRGNRAREQEGGKRDSERLPSRITAVYERSLGAETQRRRDTHTHFHFGLVPFLHASLTSILNLHCVCVFPCRIWKREMCCIRVLHWTWNRDHHWEHSKHPQWGPVVKSH